MSLIVFCIRLLDPNHAKSTSNDDSDDTSEVIEDVENALHVVQIVILSTFLIKVCYSCHDIVFANVT